MLPGLHLTSSNTELDNLAAMHSCGDAWEVNGWAVLASSAAKLHLESEPLACRLLPAEEVRWKG